MRLRTRLGTQLRPQLGMRLPAFLGAALVLCGCRALPFPDPRLEGPYGAALAIWTRKATLYDGLETRAFARVIYLSPEFVNAQAAEISSLRAELPDQAAQTRERLRAENAAPTLFAIVYVADKHSNDWEQSNSVWRLALNLGLGQMRPVSVTRIERFDAELRTLYPYLDDFSVGYLIKFPPLGAPTLMQPALAAQPGSAGAPLEGSPGVPAGFVPTDADLTVAGALGHFDLHWKLDGTQRVE